MNNQIILLFELVGVLCNGRDIRQVLRQNMSNLMSVRYGKTPEFWQAIDEQIVADWDSYHADLNFGGEDGIADMHEALFRVTRALFRLANIAEPPKSEITALSQELISLSYRDILRPDVKSVIEKYHQQYQIGVLSYLLEAQTRAVVRGLSISEHVTHIISPDTLSDYNRDNPFFIKLRQYLPASSAQIVIITNDQTTIKGAAQAGVGAILVRQSSASLEAILESKLTDRRKI